MPLLYLELMNIFVFLLETVNCIGYANEVKIVNKDFPIAFVQLVSSFFYLQRVFQEGILRELHFYLTQH